MNWVENILIILGISLDIFAAMECQGSLMVKINKRELSILCVAVAAIQMVALFLGNFLSGLLLRQGGIARNEMVIGSIIAAIIFFCLGIRLIVKAIRNERINEKREEKLHIRHYVLMAVGTSIYTVLTGIAFGFIGTSLLSILLMVCGLTILVVIAGMYTGYHFGFEQKTKAYIIGAVLLWLAGGDVIVRHILRLF